MSPFEPADTQHTEGGCASGNKLVNDKLFQGIVDMSESSKRAKSKVKSVQEFIDESRLRDTRAQQKSKGQISEKQSSKEFTDIETNPFYKILFNPDLTPLEKKEETAKVLTFAETNEESKANLQSFVKFKEYLQFQRKRMAQQIIDLTDTEAFSELQGVYKDITNALMEFEKKVAPLTDIVDAVYTLRMNGVTFDVFREIAEDKEEEERLRLLREEQEKELAKLEGMIAGSAAEIAVLKQDRLLFGLGPITQSSREKIAKQEQVIEDAYIELENLHKRIAETPKAPIQDSELIDFVHEKAKLRELLDISSEEHKERQNQLVQSAQDFINKTDGRVGGVLDHLNGMNGQLDRLSEANYTMREVYAVLNDASKDSMVRNQSIRENFKEEKEGEGDIERMERERNVRDIENYISSLSQSHVDTTGVFADLTSSSHRIMSMKDGNSQQISKTRALHTSGVAGIADQLSTVLQAVSAAALGESSEMARLSLERMNRTTQDLTQKEVIRQALGTKEVNTELGKALEDLEQYGEVIRTATDITRSGLQETQQLLTELEDTARNVQEDVRESIGVAAEVVGGRHGASVETEESVEESSVPDPFGVGK